MEKSMWIKFMTTTVQTNKLGWSLQSLIAWASDHYDHYDHPFLKLYILKEKEYLHSCSSKKIYKDKYQKGGHGGRKPANPLVIGLAGDHPLWSVVVIIFKPLILFDIFRPPLFKLRRNHA
jgi:hypothetical protein